MRPISTFTHGIVDYATAATVLTVPRLLGWSSRVRNLFGAVGLGVLGYSLCTKYELGAARMMSMRTHLAMDALGGMFCLAAPMLLRRRDRAVGVDSAFMGLGLMEIGASLLTKTESPLELQERRQAAAVPQRSINDVVIEEVVSGRDDIPVPAMIDAK